MNKNSLYKILPFLVISSLVAFLYVNISSHHPTAPLQPEKVLTEQPHANADQESEKEIHAPSIGVLAKILTIAQQFLPVSNRLEH